MKGFNKNSLRLVLITTIIITTSFIMLQQMNMTTVEGHNKNATPTEIFSLWNNTSPTIDGTIDFNSSSLSTEWSASAIYNLYDNSESLDSKILLQNDNTNLYVALDMTTFQTEVPVTVWGAAIYIDRDHNGLLSSYDRAIIFKENSTGQFVLYCYFSNSHNNWIELDDSIPGVAFGSNIKMDTSFGSSFFEQTNHRQYEFRIPFAEMNSGPGKITGIGFEAFTNYQGNDEELTWPYVSSTPSEMRTRAGFFGDIYFGKDTGLGNYYAEYAIEENTNIKSDVIGINSGLFLGTADIDGNGDLELIVSSNVTDSDENYLLAVYDFSNGVLTQNWSSWTTSHQTKMFGVKSIAAYDFDTDGKDEVYVVGEDSRILRFSDWDSDINDFGNSDYIYSHTSSLTGYLTIGDGNNDGSSNLVFGDQNGYISVLIYNLGLDSFSQDKRSPFTTDLWYGPLYSVHAVAVGDSDDDLENEILFLGQTSADDELSPTSLYIYTKSVAKYLDNPEDDLPSNSITTTEDSFGHTILVADVDNDLETETIIIGKDYIRIFRKDTFTDPAPPFELTLTDGISNPAMGGGAEVADIDNDGMNELIFGASNGTIYVMNLTKEGTGEYSFQLEWSGDIGSSPGKRSSIKVFDIDSDSESEVILGDNFGQLMILGRTNPPEVTINTPTPGSTFSSSPIYVEWSASDDFALHHFDIYVGTTFIGRTPGSQISYYVPLLGDNNLIKVVAFDVTGKNSSATVNVDFTTSAPEIQITSPENYLLTQNSMVSIEFANFDPNGDFFRYCIYVNDIWQVNQTASEETYLLTMPVDGFYNVTIVGVDDEKNIGKNSIFITRDNTDPNVNIYSPISHSYVLSSEITLRWTASDSLSGVDYFEIYKDTIYESTTTSLSYLVSLDIDKEYTFEVIAYDLVGNSDSSIIYVLRDTVQPNVTILSPIDGLISTSSSILLSWDAEDNIDGSSIHHSEVVVNQLTAYYGTAESTTVNLGEDGLKDILVTTYDRAGNSRTDYISVIVDQNNPIIVITSPFDGFTTGLDILPLSWESYDNGTGIANYEIFIDGLSIENITDTSITEWLVPIASDQNSTITIRASDYASHFYEDTITIVQNSLQPTISLVDPIEPFSYYPETQFNIHW
ncbi:MAG: Ig-like domain-containing protein [Candidatus Heimdallarchaeota archaeon]